jgi:hypothetical protein
LELKLFIRTLVQDNVTTDPSEDIRVFLSRAIGQSNLSAPAKREATAMAEKWDGATTLNELLQPDVPLKENTLFRKELGQAQMVRAGSMASLADAAIQKLVEKELTPMSINHDLLKEIVEEKILTDKEASALGLQVNILQLSIGDAQLAEALKNKVTAGQQPSLKELAGMRRTDWEAFVEKNASVTPAGAGKKELAAFLHKQVEMLFPEEVFLSHRPIFRKKSWQIYFLLFSLYWQITNAFLITLISKAWTLHPYRRLTSNQ